MADRFRFDHRVVSRISNVLTGEMSAMTMRAKLMLVLFALPIIAPVQAFGMNCPSSPRGYTYHRSSEILVSSLPGHYFQEDGLHMDVAPNSASTWLTSDSVLEKFNQAWICTAFDFPKNPEAQAALGVIFWFIDNQNYHVALVRPNGNVAVWRDSRGSFTLLQSIQSSDVVAATPDPRSDYQANLLEAIVIGNRAQIFLNDARVMSVDGSPPKEEWRAGLYALSDSKTGYDAVFFGFETVALPKPW
jgi:hypothetical protein